MVDKVNIYKSLCYQINPYVVKGIKSLDITIDELLLVLYLMNEKDYLDLLDIEEKTSLSEEEILNAYSSLLSKALIEVNIEKIDGKINETIKLDGLYNKLVYNEKPSTSENTDIYGAFEREFGKTLSPIEYETINKWLEDGISEENILSALKEAVINGVANLRYIDKIIYEKIRRSKEDTNQKYDDVIDYEWFNQSE